MAEGEVLRRGGSRSAWRGCEQGEAPLALLAAPDGSRKYVGAAVFGLNRAVRERLWERIAGMPGRAPKGIPIKKPNTQWIKPARSGTCAP
jgi:hypothetical protein